MAPRGRPVFPPRERKKIGFISISYSFFFRGGGGGSGGEGIPEVRLSDIFLRQEIREEYEIPTSTKR